MTDAPHTEDPAALPDRPVLEQFLGQQRWFAGKNRTWIVTDATTIGWLRREMPAVQLALVTVSYDDGDTETYQLPLVHSPQPAEHLSHALVGDDGQTWAYDALHDKEVTPLWFDGIEREVTGEGFRFQCDYQNSTDLELRFGVNATDEMCTLNAVYWLPEERNDSRPQGCLLLAVDPDGVAR